jgi:hypothetical protein
MKSIITTYPDFQMLPRGVKAMLLISESQFFLEAKNSLAKPGSDKPTTSITPKPVSTRFSHSYEF